MSGSYNQEDAAYRRLNKLEKGLAEAKEALRSLYRYGPVEGVEGAMEKKGPWEDGFNWYSVEAVDAILDNLEEL